LMFEIDNPVTRADFLGKAGGIEEKVYMTVDKEKIIATPERDLDRTSAEGKASSVQFIHFNFSSEQIEKFRDFKNKITLSIEHKIYNHKIEIEENVRKALIFDFS